MNKKIKQIPIENHNRKIKLPVHREIGVLVETAASRGETSDRLTIKSHFIPLGVDTEITPCCIPEVAALIMNDRSFKEAMTQGMNSGAYLVIGYRFVKRISYYVSVIPGPIRKSIFKSDRPHHDEVLSDRFLIFPGGRFINEEEFIEICNGDESLPAGEKYWEEGWAFENFGYLDISHPVGYTGYKDITAPLDSEAYNEFFGAILATNLVLPFPPKKKNRLPRDF